MTPEEKACKRCGEVLPLDQFPANKECRDGREGSCRKCHADRCRSWRAEHGEQALAYARQNKEKYRDRVNAYQRESRSREASRERQRRHRRSYAARHPEKVKARLDVRRALSSGVLTKPDRCSRCGRRVAARFIHGHHHNGYSRPLDVEWVCLWCHNAEHYSSAIRSLKETP